MVLTVVVTVMNGFDRELKTRLLNSVPHIMIPVQVDAAPEPQDLLALSGVSTVSPYFRGLGALSFAGRVRPVTFYGVDATGLGAMAAVVASLGGMNAALSLLDRPDAVVLGAALAQRLGVAPGDRLTAVMTVPSGDSIAARTSALQVAGTFEIGADPDYNLALLSFASRSEAEWSRVGRLGLRLQLDDPMQVGLIKQALIARYPGMQMLGWDQSYGELFKAIGMEKSMMFLLLLLIVAIAAFNVIAGQTMMVHDRRGHIAILRTMGASARMIRGIFLVQGSMICIVGTLAGLGLGVWLAGHINTIVDMLAGFTGQHLLDGSYFITVPTEVRYGDLILIAGLSMGLAFWAALLPAVRASRLDPAKHLY